MCFVHSVLSSTFQLRLLKFPWGLGPLPPILPGRGVWDAHPPPLLAPELFSSPRTSSPVCSLSCSQLWVWDKQNPGLLAVSADKEKFSLGAAELQGCRLRVWGCQRLKPTSPSVAEVRAERSENTISDRLGCPGPRSRNYLFPLTLNHLDFLGNNNQKYSNFLIIFQLKIYLYSTSESIYTQHHPLLLSGLFSSQQLLSSKLGGQTARGGLREKKERAG